MYLARTFVFALIAGALVTAQARSASVFPPAVPAAYTIAMDDQQNDEQNGARDRGVLQGEIVGIDYPRGILHLQTRRGRIDVLIQPSTNIMRRGDQYGTIADLAQGAHISINVSEVGGRLVAQIIRIQ